MKKNLEENKSIKLAKHKLYAGRKAISALKKVEVTIAKYNNETISIIEIDYNNIYKCEN